MGALVPDFDNEKNDYLQIALEKLSDIESGILVKLDGFVDTYNSSFFQNQISKVISAGYTKLVFDAKNLSYISSTGIGSFINVWKELKTNGGSYIFLNIQKKVLDVFQILGFAQSFTFVTSIDEAKAFYNK